MSAGTLYTFIGSGNSYKVRLLEALLGIQLKHKELDFLADDQHQPEFLEINPRGEVPCLVDGDKASSLKCKLFRDTFCYVGHNMKQELT